MTIFQAIFLGVLQGLGEFLPISSTAHLILLPWFFGWDDPGLSFDVALHVGTLVAVVAFFWRDWLTIFQLSLQKISNFKFQISNSEAYPPQLLWLLVIASVPGAIFGFMLDNKAEEAFRSPLLVAFTLSVVGLVLFLVDKYAIHRKEIGAITKKDALLIGLSQAIAIIPGVSRSGATMTTGLFLGLSREQAARFSFLLSTPIIFGAAIVKVPQLFRAGITMPLLFGILAAAISGYFAIKYMLKFIAKVGYAPFFYYRIVLAGLIVLVYFMK
ncbi:MAG: undecaprenyl-diphosphate phosphatase [Candidatus Moranbacteria bacterium]|nr:undecaprenyl-diphosphate phosphatase [Candidatus Moranbacteria bacterium]